MSSNRVLIAEKINNRFRAMTGSKTQNSGLSNTIEMICRDLPIDHYAFNAVENIHNILTRRSYDKVIFEATCVNGRALRGLRESFPNTRFYVHFHSNLPFLAEEGDSLVYVKEYIDGGVGIIWNSEQSFMAMKTLPGAVYLPNVYHFEEFTQLKEEGPVLDVGCFGSIRSMKNQLMQAAAAIRMADMKGKKLRFHMNVKRTENGSSAKNNLLNLFKLHPKHELVEVPWMEHKDFIQYLRNLDIGMQVSLTETFNMVAADYVSAGVPMVVSEEVRWASAFSQVSTGDIISIINGMNRAINEEGKQNLISYHRNRLRGFSEESKRLWLEFINS